MDFDTSSPRGPAEPASPGGALMAGGMAAILASTCCLGPLVLLMLGVSGAWIGSLAAVEPYRPGLIVAALLALFLAWRRIWRPAGRCAPGQPCRVQRARRADRLLFGAVVFMVLIALAFPLAAPWFY